MIRSHKVIFNILSLCILIICITHSSNGHTYHSGSCPTVEPMPNFEMRRFLGIWYAIQKTSTASTCLIYNITLGDEPGEFKIEQVSQHFALGLTSLKHEYSYTGQISVPYPDVPAKMTVKFPLNVAGSSSFTVFLTDYDTFAGIFSCQKLGFVHRRSATLLSRTRQLDRIYVDKLRTKLASYLVDPFELSIINQTGCPKDHNEGYHIHIDDETFSSHNIANVFRKAGEKIGDGFEYAVGTGKKLYKKVSDDDSSEKSARLIEIPTPDPNSEWIRV